MGKMIDAQSIVVAATATNSMARKATSCASSSSTPSLWLASSAYWSRCRPTSGRSPQWWSGTKAWDMSRRPIMSDRPAPYGTAIRKRPERESMKVGLFIPCYIDAFFPEVGIATLELLERLGSRSSIRSIRPAAGSRWPTAVARTMRPPPRRCSCRTSRISTRRRRHPGSCVHHVRYHLDAIPQTAEAQKVRRNGPMSWSSSCTTT